MHNNNDKEKITARFFFFFFQVFLAGVYKVCAYTFSLLIVSYTGLEEKKRNTCRKMPHNIYIFIY